ncbi:MAG: hypothetical protein CVT72_09535, partial [Alphaproteobacteria bacterium HGW-Alphaproteobacteria-11]
MRSGFRPKYTALWTIAVLALAGFPMLAADRAFAQSGGDFDMRAIDNRLDRIEREITDLQRQSYSGGGSTGVPTSLSGGGVGAADAQSRIFELEEQVRRLNGNLEEMGHRIEQVSQEMQRFKADTDLRFQDAQGGGGASAALGEASGGAMAPVDDDGEGPGPATAEGTLGTAPVASVLPQGTPQVQYDFAIDLMKRGQYDQARAAFVEFLQLHPKDTLAGNAQYWLGETYYAQN